MTEEIAGRRRRRAVPATSTPDTQVEEKLDQSVKVAEKAKATGVSAREALKAQAKRDEAQPLFDTAPGQKLDAKNLPQPDMQRGFHELVTNLFDETDYNVMTEWEAIRAGLKVKDALTPGSLRSAANEQEELAERASRLYIVALIEVRQYIRETDTTWGALREQAIEYLHVMKASGSRSKQITDADALAEAARQFPEEWTSICMRREKAEAMLEHLKNLAALAKSRCYTISNMANPNARFG